MWAHRISETACFPESKMRDNGTRQLAAVLLLGFFCLAISSSAYADGITILSATYGRSCRITDNNAGQSVAAACNGRTTCQYRIDVKKLGDPRFGCRKDFVATYTCSGNAQPRNQEVPAEAGLGSVLNLDCSSSQSVADTATGAQTEPPVPVFHGSFRACEGDNVCNAWTFNGVEHGGDVGALQGRGSIVATLVVKDTSPSHFEVWRIDYRGETYGLTADYVGRLEDGVFKGEVVKYWNYHYPPEGKREEFTATIVPDRDEFGMARELSRRKTVSETLQEQSRIRPPPCHHGGIPTKASVGEQTVYSNMALAVYDAPTALCWAELAAAGGSVRAEYLWGLILSSNFPDVDVNWPEANRHLLGAANRGNLDALRHRVELYKIAPIQDRQHWIDDATAQYNEWLTNYNKICQSKVVEDAMLDLTKKTNAQTDIKDASGLLGALFGIKGGISQMRLISSTVFDALHREAFTCEAGFQINTKFERTGESTAPDTDTDAVRQRGGFDRLLDDVNAFGNFIVSNQAALNQIEKFQVFLLTSQSYPDNWDISMPYVFNHFMKSPMRLEKIEIDNITVP